MDLEQRKQASTLQLLFKAARLLDEAALTRVAMLPGRPKLRPAHTALFPHIDLEGTRVNDLAERVGVSKQAISQVLDDLESWKIVARKKDPEDARARLVMFTDLGKRGLLEGLQILTDLEVELGAAIGDEHIKRLRSALLRILEHLKK